MKRSVALLAVVVVLLLTSPWAWTEVMLIGRDVRKSPDGRQYARVASPSEVVVDEFPCANMTMASPCLRIVGRVTSIRWRDRETIVVATSYGSDILQSTCPGAVIIERAYFETSNPGR